MKFLVPWLAFAVCLVAAALLLKEKSRLSEELAASRAAQAALEPSQAQADDPSNRADASSELTRLRTENAELHRLRNEVRTLKSQNSSSSGARGVVQAALGGQPEANSAENFTLVEDIAKLKTELEDLKAEKLRMQAEACAQNLFLLQNAIGQWALENRKKPGENVLPQNIIPYLRAQTFPVCPSGGTYSTRPLGMPPTCSLPAHSFGQ